MKSIQNGATLAVALLLLLVITLIGVGTIQVTQMQEKMSGNLQDKEMSFLATESAVAAGEAWLLAQTSQPDVNIGNCGSYPCVQSVYENLNLAAQTSAWWSSRSAEYSLNLNKITTKPRYITEYLQFVPDTPVVGNGTQNHGVTYYQVTGHGNGATDSAASVIQTTVARRF